MFHTATLIPGDGVGPEITEATRRVVEVIGVVLGGTLGGWGMLVAS